MILPSLTGHLTPHLTLYPPSPPTHPQFLLTPKKTFFHTFPNHHHHNRKIVRAKPNTGLYIANCPFHVSRWVTMVVTVILIMVTTMEISKMHRKALTKQRLSVVPSQHYFLGRHDMTHSMWILETRIWQLPQGYHRIIFTAAPTLTHGQIWWCLYWGTRCIQLMMDVWDDDDGGYSK